MKVILNHTGPNSLRHLTFAENLQNVDVRKVARNLARVKLLNLGVLPYVTVEVTVIEANELLTFIIWSCVVFIPKLYTQYVLISVVLSRVFFD